MTRIISPSDGVRVSSVSGGSPGMGEFARVGDLLGGAAGVLNQPSYTTLLNQGPLRRDLFTFTNLPVTITSVTTGRGVGGTKFFTFPKGWIRHHFTRGRLSFSIPAAQQEFVTDGTPEGDVGIGTVAPANADALGTDATDDDFGTAAAVNITTGYAVSGIVIPSEAAAAFDGTTTAKALFMNMAVDAADIDDSASVIYNVSGWLMVGWSFEGDTAV